MESLNEHMNITMTANDTTWRDAHGCVCGFVEHREAPAIRIVMSAKVTTWKNSANRVQDRIIHKYVERV